jgi:hypothetical protein
VLVAVFWWGALTALATPPVKSAELHNPRLDSTTAARERSRVSRRH